MKRSYVAENMCAAAWEALKIDPNLLPQAAGVDPSTCKTDADVEKCIRDMVAWLRDKGCSYRSIGLFYPYLKRECDRQLKELQAKPLSIGDVVMEMAKTQSQSEGVVVGFAQCNGKEQPLVLFSATEKPRFSSKELLTRI